MRLGRAGGAWLLVAGAIAMRAAGAQDSTPAPSTPRVVALAERVRVLGTDAPRLAILDKTIAVDLDDVPLGAALHTIAREAGLKLSYRELDVWRARPVSL